MAGDTLLQDPRYLLAGHRVDDSQRVFTLVRHQEMPPVRGRAPGKSHSY